MNTRKTFLAASLGLPLAVGSMLTGAANADAATAPPVGQSIRQVSDYKSLGTPTGPETLLKNVSGAGRGYSGYYQNFTGGTAYYRTSTVHGAVSKNLTGFSVAAYGWPNSGTSVQCGGLRVSTESGYYATGNRWCPDAAYAQPVNAIATPVMPTQLSTGDAGVNVMLVQNKLIGLHYLSGKTDTFLRQLAQIQGATATAISKYRSSHGLSNQPIIDLALWKKLGITAPWAIGTTPQKTVTGTSATKQQHIDAFLNFVQRQTRAANVPYTYGSAGSAAYGFDCSGLMLAGLQAAGLQTSATVRNDIIWPTKLTQALYQEGTGAVGLKNEGVKHDLMSVPFGQRQAGDLVFFTKGPIDANDIVHTGVVLKNGQIFDTEGNGHEGYARSRDKIEANVKRGWGNSGVMPLVVRPFA